jgi:hypothetical protein
MVRTTVIKQKEQYKWILITGISELLEEGEEVRVYGVFERVSGGVVYSAPDDELFDDLATDDINHLLGK